MCVSGVSVSVECVCVSGVSVCVCVCVCVCVRIEGGQCVTNRKPCWWVVTGLFHPPPPPTPRSAYYKDSCTIEPSTCTCCEFKVRIPSFSLSYSCSSSLLLSFSLHN